MWGITVIINATSTSTLVSNFKKNYQFKKIKREKINRIKNSKTHEFRYGFILNMNTKIQTHKIQTLEHKNANIKKMEK